MSDINAFSILPFPGRDAAIEEAIEIVLAGHHRQGTRDGGVDAPEAAAKRSAAHDAFEKLKKEHARFSPVLKVHQLDDAELRKVPAAPDLMRTYRLVQLGFPITMFPLSGFAFTRLECHVEFCPGEQHAHRAVIQDLLPNEQWQDVMVAETRAELAAGGHLSFATSESSVDARVGSTVKLGPFGYQARRAVVRARGRGDVQCFWRLDSRKLVDEEALVLGVLLAVPRARRNKPLTAIGELRACHDFQWLTADIFKDWIPHFGDAVRSLLSSGAMVEATQRWMI